MTTTITIEPKGGCAGFRFVSICRSAALLAACLITAGVAADVGDAVDAAMQADIRTDADRARDRPG